MWRVCPGMEESSQNFVVLDHPYVSDVLEATLARLQVPVMLAAPDVAVREPGALRLLDREAFFAAVGAAARPRLYANSENPLAIIRNGLEMAARGGGQAGTAGVRSTGRPNSSRLESPAARLARSLGVVKDKAAVREALRSLYPGLWFRRVRLDELDGLDVAGLRFPLVLKPAIGFFSVGVVAVRSAAEWPAAVAEVRRQFDQWRGVYPRSVLDDSFMLVEQFVEGVEYAVDVYWDGEGRPVIVNLMAHLFRDADDTIDRVYWTSAELLRAQHAPLTETLREIGERLALTDFPAHVELRAAPSGPAVPIEINPLRFAGFGATDLAWFAFGSDSHDAFLREFAPDWDTLLRGREDKVYCLVVCDIPATIDRSQIVEVRWDELAASFDGLLALRPMDYRRYPVLAFAFIQSDDMGEPGRQLDVDFTQYVRTR
jgi:ATP-grasp domain